MTEQEYGKEREIFSAPELLTIRETFERELATHLDDGERITCHGVLLDERVVLRLELADQRRTRVLKLEAATELETERPEELLEARADAVEFMYQMLEEYLASGTLEAPNPDWHEYRYAERAFVFRGLRRNEELEEMTQQWLREHADELEPELLVDEDVERLKGEAERRAESPSTKLH